MTHLEHQNQRGWLERMLTWDSRVSIGFDILFGTLPALYFGLLSGMGTLISILSIPDFLFRLHTVPISELQIVLQSLFGFYACVSMIFVTMMRSKVSAKRVLIFGLASGIVVVCYLVFTQIGSLTSSPIALTFLLLIVSPAVVAIKHIVILVQARGLA